jgi:hypothetical protein
MHEKLGPFAGGAESCALMTVVGGKKAWSTTDERKSPSFNFNLTGVP